MKILFQNHSSILMHSDDQYLLTDPWYNRPAFGSWLPSLAPYIHPTYLAALGDKISILISHGHDDHFDDRLLELFNKKTQIITAAFKAPSVINRLKRLGFENVVTVGDEEVQIGDKLISSYIVEEFSHDDAAFLIRNKAGAVLHLNDNYNVLSQKHEKLIKSRVGNYDKDSVLLFSQTNSASGFPLNYRRISTTDKIKILRTKVAKMVESGLRNAENLGLKKMFSYAGYASAYVRDKDYEKVSLFPSARFLKRLLSDEGIKSTVDIVDLYPGDSISLPDGKVSSAFVRDYQDSEIKNITDNFYKIYGNINECISYRKIDIIPDYLDSWLDDFLKELFAFTQRRIQGVDSHYNELSQKTFSIDVHHKGESIIQKTLSFSDGLVEYDSKANKICYVSANMIFKVLTGESLFEDLYTGYNAEWDRNPQHIYNRDIIMMITMFSYVYKNRLLPNYLSKYTQDNNPVKVKLK